MKLFVAVVSFFAPTVLGWDVCVGNTPIFGGKVCGPDNALGYLGPDEALFYYWSISWSAIKRRSNTAQFTSVCRAHDACYDIIDAKTYASKTQCMSAFDYCNGQFERDFEAVCAALPKKCQRNECHYFYRNFYSGLVEAAVSAYAADYCPS